MINLSQSFGNLRMVAGTNACWRQSCHGGRFRPMHQLPLLVHTKGKTLPLPMLTPGDKMVPEGLVGLMAFLLAL